MSCRTVKRDDKGIFVFRLATTCYAIVDIKRHKTYPRGPLNNQYIKANGFFLRRTRAVRGRSGQAMHKVERDLCILRLNCMQIHLMLWILSRDLALEHPHTYTHSTAWPIASHSYLSGAERQ